MARQDFQRLLFSDFDLLYGRAKCLYIAHRRLAEEPGVYSTLNWVELCAQNILIARSVPPAAAGSIRSFQISSAEPIASVSNASRDLKCLALLAAGRPVRAVMRDVRKGDAKDEG
jgi:hypothetical protein